MRIKTWIKFTEGYLPTPRHKKLRYKECESIEEVTINEISINQTRLKYKIGEVEIVNAGMFLTEWPVKN